MAVRTDLAVEAMEMAGKLPRSSSQHTAQKQGYELTQTVIGSDDRITGKPPGRYDTLSLSALERREPDAFPRACRAVAECLADMTTDISKSTPVLIAGLGNRAITPDAVGPLTCEFVLATRHLVRQAPEQFASFRPVSVLAPGVLGTTGLESAEILRGVLEQVKPGLIVAVDALAARRLNRLLHTVQLTDTGIIPGSGIGNSRAALNREMLGIPVVGMGVPTVVDGATIAADIAAQSGSDCEALRELNTPMLVTVRDIDRQVRAVARVIGYGLNLFLHPDLDVEDIDAFLS